MIRTMYTVNRNMNVLQKKQENTSGNLANSNTTGYKFKSIMQSTLESHEMVNFAGGRDKDKRQVIGEFIFGNQIDENIVSFTDGNIMETGNFTDLALQGDGFFTVELPGGGRGYTRNGNFRLDEQGALVTQSGDRLLSINENSGAIGPVFADESLKIDNIGRVNGSNVRLLISDMDDYSGLVDRGDTIFTSNGAMNIVENPTLIQNFLESSNVDFTNEIIRMIEISREFESNQKMIQAADETLSKAVNELGRL